MNSIAPVCPNCNAPCPHVDHKSCQTNNYNGAAIEIHNPTVNVPAYTQSIYDMPKASVYAEQPKVEDVK